jgi:shikimate kinase
MGSGKSSVGKALASLLGWKFIDLDNLIESRQKRKIHELFSAHGEEGFRLLETEALRILLCEAERPLVLATGGGTFVRVENAALLRTHSALIVFLEASAETLMKRCCIATAGTEQGVRPLARDRDSFLRLYEQRLPFYRGAELTFDSDNRTPEEVACEIEGALRARSQMRITL